ncbi:hypothetical protein HYDPIDRAFT_103285, partial [Hydnomerulius pinastri MD-312]
GDSFAAVTYQNSQVSKTQFERIMGYIESGKADGATIHVGGNRIGSEGYSIQPTIFTKCQPDMKIVCEEIFGPVACVLKFQTIDRASKHGLAASVFTKDIDRGFRVAHALEAGAMWVRLRSLFPINTSRALLMLATSLQESPPPRLSMAKPSVR